MKHMDLDIFDAFVCLFSFFMEMSSRGIKMSFFWRGKISLTPYFIHSTILDRAKSKFCKQTNWVSQAKMQTLLFTKLSQNSVVMEVSNPELERNQQYQYFGNNIQNQQQQHVSLYICKYVFCFMKLEINSNIKKYGRNFTR